VANKGFWKVGQWFPGTESSIAFGFGNDAGGNVILGLADAVDFEDRPIVIKRIIGQYNVVRIQSGPFVAAYVHHRIAMGRTDIAATTVSTQDLFDPGGAEDDFLWHETQVMTPALGTSHMNPLGATAPRVVPQRWGAFDVRVARKVDNLSTLYWHSQSPAAVADQWALHLWCRMWCMEVG